MRVFFFISLGALAGMTTVGAHLLVQMIFWRRTTLDLSGLPLDMVCGAAAGAILVTFIALVRNAFVKME